MYNTRAMESFEFVGKEAFRIRDVEDSYREIEQVGQGSYG